RMLSPATSSTRIAIGSRPGKVMVQLDASAPALISVVTSALSLPIAIVLTLHLPATSARVIGAGMAAAAAAAAESAAAAASSLDLPQAIRARTAREARELRISSSKNGGPAITEWAVTRGPTYSASPERARRGVVRREMGRRGPRHKTRPGRFHGRHRCHPPVIKYG